MKSLYEYVSDVGEEIGVEITAAFDIHTDVARAAIEKCLFGFGLIGRVEDGARKGMAEHPKEFPSLGVVSVFKSSAKVRYAPPSAKAVEQTIAAELKRGDDEFIVDYDGAEHEERKPMVYDIAAPSETVEIVPAPDGQEMVGSSKVSALYKELSKRAEDEQKARAEKLKKIVVTQLGLKDVFEQVGARGYYSVVILEDGGVKTIAGPFQDRPDGQLVRNKEQLGAAVAKLDETVRGAARYGA